MGYGEYDRCEYCDGYVQYEQQKRGSPGVVCKGCFRVVHLQCLEDHRLLSKTSGGLFSSGDTIFKCPHCGKEQKADW